MDLGNYLIYRNKVLRFGMSILYRFDIDSGPAGLSNHLCLLRPTFHQGFQTLHPQHLKQPQAN
jgi:hypothetical protein